MSFVSDIMDSSPLISTTKRRVHSFGLGQELQKNLKTKINRPIYKAIITEVFQDEARRKMFGIDTFFRELKTLQSHQKKGKT